MLFLFAFLPAILAHGSFADPPDFVYRHMAHQLDHNVRPCDNFFRHVCPRTISKEETVKAQTIAFLNNITRVPRFEANLVEMLNKTEAMLYELESHFQTLSDKQSCDCNVAYGTEQSNICAFVCSNPNITSTVYSQSWNSVIKTHHTILRFDEYEKLTEIEKSLKIFTDKLSEQMFNELNSTNPANTYHDKLLIALKEKHGVFTPIFENLKQHGIAISTNYIEWSKNIKKLYRHFVMNDTLDDAELEEELRQFARLYNIMRKYTHKVDFGFNAGNSGMFSTTHDISMTFGAVIMFNEARNRALQFGLLNMVLGHEVAHTYTVLRETYMQSAVYHARAECIAGKYQHACKRFAEADLRCGSDFPHTHQEDASDVVGARIAYKAFLDAFDEKLDDVTLQIENGDATFTNRQLFFYGSAIASCVEKERSGHKYDERDIPNVHSGALFRVNANLREMAAFSEAFNCQPGDAMYQDPAEQCLLFGEAPLFM